MKTIYSDYLEEMIPVGFTVDTVHYTWNEEDLLYCSDEIDGDYYIGVPIRAILD